VSVIRFQPADFNKDIQVSDEDVQKHYEGHKAELKTDEKRKVELFSLALTDEEKKFTGKERIEALQKLSDRATDFTQALLEKGADFKQAAAKLKLPVRETGEFTKAEPDPQLKGDAQLGAAAFKLSMQEAISDPIQVADGFYILHLAGISEARPAHTRRSEAENCGDDQEVEGTRADVDESSRGRSTITRSEAVRATT